MKHLDVQEVPGTNWSEHHPRWLWVNPYKWLKLFVKFSASYYFSLDHHDLGSKNRTCLAVVGISFAFNAPSQSYIAQQLRCTPICNMRRILFLRGELPFA